MTKAVLFDLDGTLTDTLTDIANAMNWALKKNGLPPYPRDAYRYLVGNGAWTLTRRAVAGHDDLVEAVHADYQARYETHNLVETRPYDGIPALLEALRGRGLRLCVLSNKPDADTVNVVRHFFGEGCFDIVRGQREGVPLKPDPTAALEVASALDIASGEFAYLGDTAVDMTCAVRAGMRPIGVLWGFRDAVELRESGASALISAPGELLSLIEV